MKKALSFLFLLCFLSSPAFASKAAPVFQLPTETSQINLNKLKGKVVYLDFWASWCKPCRKSFPFLNEMQRRHGNQGLMVIGINVDSNRKDATKFLKKYHANFTIAFDEKGVTPGKYNVAVMPTSFIIDRNGNIVNIHKGFREDHQKKIEAMITKTLAAK